MEETTSRAASEENDVEKGMRHAVEGAEIPDDEEDDAPASLAANARDGED